MGLDLVTLAEYKTYANILGTSQDAAISAMIPRISNLVKTTCRRTFLDYVDDPRVEVFRGGHDRLYLNESPLIALQSLEFSSDYGSTYTALVEFTDYVVDVEDNAIEFIVEPYKSYKRVNAFKATYTAGYEVLPPDLKLAVMDALMHQIRNDGAIHSTKNIGSNTTQMDYLTNAQLPAHIRRVLQLYSDNYN
jgi:hypothetical protein